MLPRTRLSIALAALSVAAPSTLPVASASSPAPKPSYFSAWSNRYPGSLSAANAACQLCHEQTNGHEPWNGYGWDLRELILSGGMGIDQALAAVEGNDSDLDPTGSTNLEEILADAQPGWTDGANNTLYFEDGTTMMNVNPPAGLGGDLDPPVGGCGGAATGNYCSSAPFSTGLSTITVSPSEVSITANPTMTASANNLPDQPGIFIAGPAQAAIPFFNGTLCIAPTGLQRFSTVNVPSAGVVVQSFTIADAAAGGLLVVADTTYNFQRWNRDPAGGGGAANFSDGFAVCFTP